MGNKTSTSSSDLAEKAGISTEEVEQLISAFKEGNKKGGPVKVKKFKKIVAEVCKINHSDNFTPEAADMLFAVLDADKNGKVDAEEFITGVTVLSSGSNEDKAKLVFKAIDKNNSGSINKAEFRAYVTKTIEVAKAIYNQKTKEEGLNLACRFVVLCFRTLTNKLHKRLFLI